MNDKYNALQLPEEKRKDALTNLAEAADRAPSRWGRVPTVLQGFIPPSEEEEAAALDTIPGMGAYLSAKPDALNPGKGFKRVRDDLEMDDAEFARLSASRDRAQRFRRSEGSTVGALPGFVRPATVNRLKSEDEGKVKLEQPPKLPGPISSASEDRGGDRDRGGERKGHVHPDRLQMLGSRDDKPMERLVPPERGRRSPDRSRRGEDDDYRMRFSS
jgi:hypothetical protein